MCEHVEKIRRVISELGDIHMFNNLCEHLKPVSQMMKKHKPIVGRTFEDVADSLILQNHSRPGTAVVGMAVR